MAMNNQRYRNLFDQYLHGTLPPEEFPVLRDFLIDERHTEELDQWLQHAFRNPALREAGDGTVEAAYSALLARIQSEKQTASVSWRPRRPNWWGLAAAVAVLLAVGVWLSRDRWSTAPGEVIRPGGNIATLTMADGTTIDLSTEQSGIIVGDGITYLDGSLVLGEQVKRGTSEQVHTLTTPKGGTYQITLPDGTKVWLNAASSLRYPGSFDGDERVVELEGEAYFEVSEQVNERSQKMPFKVITSGQTVEVLGTRFNISAYADDPEIKTTLVEGKVKVALAASTVHRSPTTDRRPPITLSPGEQSIVRARLPGQGAAIDIQQVDVNQYTAWKDNDFVFRNDPLPSVMRQIARWYDVEVTYAPDAPMGLRIGGMVSRYDDIHVLLGIMAETGKVNFNIDGRRIAVTR